MQKEFARSAEAIAKVDELTSKLDIAFFVVSCYVDTGASKNMTFNKKDLSRLKIRRCGPI